MDLGSIPTRSERELYVKDKCLALLKQYGGDIKEHAKQLALFIADEMSDDYKPKTFHDEEPEIIKDYKSLADEKARMAWDKEFPEWRKRDDVSAHNDKKYWVLQDNASSEAFLQGCVDALEGTEFVLQKQKLLNMVAEYPSAKVTVATVNWQD